MGDVRSAAWSRSSRARAFLAERGGGRRAAAGRCRPNDDLERMFWTYGFRGRPARPMAEVLGELIDASSVGGATFDLGSATFDMTRIVTGQLDAYVEPGPRIVEEVPGMRGRVRARGRRRASSTTRPTTSPPRR